MFSANLACALQSACEREHCSQSALAARCGISTRFIGKIINGRASPTIDILEKLCAGLRLTPSELLLLSEEQDLSYRIPASVKTSHPLGDHRVSPCVICPRCNVPLDRDYQNYCNCCGQHLFWGDVKE